MDKKVALYEWIPISSGKLPATTDSVWVTLDDGTVILADEEDGKWYFADSGEAIWDTIVAWMYVYRPNPYRKECAHAEHSGVNNSTLYCIEMAASIGYEDLEEKGLVLKLPCKIGDTIYVIPSKVNYDLNIINGYSENNRVLGQKVHSVEIYDNCKYLIKTCNGSCAVLSDSYGETWFLYKNEAEIALNKLCEVENE